MVFIIQSKNKKVLCNWPSTADTCHIHLATGNSSTGEVAAVQP